MGHGRLDDVAGTRAHVRFARQRARLQAFRTMQNAMVRQPGLLRCPAATPMPPTINHANLPVALLSIYPVGELARAAGRAPACCISIVRVYLLTRDDNARLFRGISSSRGMTHLPRAERCATLSPTFSPCVRYHPHLPCPSTPPPQHATPTFPHGIGTALLSCTSSCPTLFAPTTFSGKAASHILAAAGDSVC